LEIKEMLKDNEKIIYEQDNQLEEKEEEIEKLKKEISQVKEKKKEDDEFSNQRHIMEIKENLKDNEEIISEQKIQLENKEEEIKRLKTKVVELTKEKEEGIERLKNEISQAKEEEIKRLKNEINQANEEKKEDDEPSKSLAYLKELRESYVNLKIQLEEAKRREEVARNQFNKKEESCHELKAEVVNFRKKVEKSNTQIKFLNSSMTLDEILDSQISPNEKSVLGYNKEEISTPKKPNAGPSFVKSENRFDTGPSFVRDEDRSDTGPSFVRDEDRSDTTPSFVKSEIQYESGSSRPRNKGNTTKFRRSDQGRYPEATHIPQRKFRREIPS
jgi:chromosome segregation ATPase